MNEMIERYIYDVTRRLSEDERGEVKRELAANIADMLSDDPGEREIIDVLTKLGPPRLLAEKYRQKQRYLISPAMFELYISVLKTVVLIVAIICACVGAFLAVFSSGPASDAESLEATIGMGIATTIEMVIQGALQTAFWVTLGFVIAEFAGSKQEPWTVKDLPRLPDKASVNISRSSSIAGIVLSVFFPVLLITMIMHGEWFIVWAPASEVINPFSQAALYRCIPFLILLGVIGLIINGLKLRWARWNVKLCIVNILQNIAWLSIVLYILHWPDLFSSEAATLANSLFENDADILGFIHSGGVVMFFTVVFIAAAAIDSGISIWNTWKGTREQD